MREKRKEWFSQMEAKLKEMHTQEDDSLFYYHSSGMIAFSIIIPLRIGLYCHMLCFGR